jgi:F-type H+-transporting ATPase subunit gamma
MVAAAKMRKSIEAVLRTRTYANLSWATVLNLSRANGNGNGKPLHPLLCKKNGGGKVCVILITSNRGLCGGYNTAVINKAHRSILKHRKEGDEPTEFITIGRKGSAVRRYFGYDIVADFPKADIAWEVNEVRSVSRMIVKDFLDGKYRKIMVAYTDFVSAAKQVPRVKQLLPVDVSAEEEHLGIVGADTRVGVTEEYLEEKQEKYLKDEKFTYDYTFEPSPEEVLDEMIPRLIEVQLFQALLESNASEHSARMSAMHQANGAAEDMVSELTLFYNKARQAAITQEISEISAGANALA